MDKRMLIDLPPLLKEEKKKEGNKHPVKPDEGHMRVDLPRDVLDLLMEQQLSILQNKLIVPRILGLRFFQFWLNYLRL